MSLTKLSESSLFLVAYRPPLSELSSRLNLLFLTMKICCLLIESILPLR